MANSRKVLEEIAASLATQHPAVRGAIIQEIQTLAKTNRLDLNNVNLNDAESIRALGDEQRREFYRQQDAGKALTTFLNATSLANTATARMAGLGGRSTTSKTTPTPTARSTRRSGPGAAPSA